jgi:hypothetical protein
MWKYHQTAAQLYIYRMTTLSVAQEISEGYTPSGQGGIRLLDVFELGRMLITGVK